MLNTTRITPATVKIVPRRDKKLTFYPYLNTLTTYEVTILRNPITHMFPVLLVNFKEQTKANCPQAIGIPDQKRDKSIFLRPI